MTITLPKLLLAGMSEGLSMAFASTCTESGYDVVGFARSSRTDSETSGTVTRAGVAYEHVICNLGNPDVVAEQWGLIVDDASVAIFNAHQLLIVPLAKTKPKKYLQVWQICVSVLTLWHTPFCLHGRSAVRAISL